MVIKQAHMLFLLFGKSNSLTCLPSIGGHSNIIAHDPSRLKGWVGGGLKISTWHSSKELFEMTNWVRIMSKIQVSSIKWNTYFQLHSYILIYISCMEYRLFVPHCWEFRGLCHTWVIISCFRRGLINIISNLYSNHMLLDLKVWTKWAMTWAAGKYLEFSECIKHKLYKSCRTLYTTIYKKKPF